MIAGCNKNIFPVLRHIFDFIFAAIFDIPELFEDFLKNYGTALPIVLNYDHHSKAVQSSITKRIIQFYFNDEAPSAAKKQNITNVRQKACSNQKCRLTIHSNYIFSCSLTGGSFMAWI